MITAIHGVVNYQVPSETPTAPVLLTAVADDDTNITLTWSASTDDVAVTGYEYRVDGGTPVDVGNVLTIQVDSLSPATEYDFEVRAYDVVPNYSAWSNLLSETTDVVLINVALASNGSTASASSAGVNASPSICINGVRHTNNNWSGNGYASDPLPQWFEVDFGTSRTISEIRTYSLSSTLGVNYNTDPDASDTTTYALIDFTVEYWNGSTWVNIDTVTGNNKTLQIFTFSPIVTTKIRVSCTAGGDGRLFMVEMEAQGY